MRVKILTALSAAGLVALGACNMTTDGGGVAFAPVAGTYTGQYQPDQGAARDLVIEIEADGDYKWIMDGEFLTDGELTQLASGGLQYENVIGSRGRVTQSGDTLSWRNVFTGDNYTVTVTR